MGRRFVFFEKAFLVHLSQIVIDRRRVNRRRRGRVRAYLIELQKTPVGQIVQGDGLVGKQLFHNTFDLADQLTVGW